MVKKNPKPVGTIIKNFALAKTLTTIANQGIKPFYHGEIAKKIVHKVKHSSVNPGFLELADLQNYQSSSGKLLCSTYRSYKIALCHLVRVVLRFCKHWVFSKILISLNTNQILSNLFI
jgi:gamma-glutamyltranspeptidase